MTAKKFLPFPYILGIISVLSLALLFTLTALPTLLLTQNKLTPEQLTGAYESNRTGTYYGKTVMAPPESTDIPKVTVLGDTTQEKHIEIDLTNQRLYAFEGDRKVYDFLISSGKWGRTPTGTFRIWTKIRYTRMTGGNKAWGTFYDLPNVPFTMFFANADYPPSLGFGIHGTYWHHNFGHPMSHGCINMKTEEVEKIYYWANPELGDQTSIRATPDNPGTVIHIYGTPPLD